jgi:hypothetical protein
MRTIVSGQHAASPEEFAELALGIDTELFRGPSTPETPEQHAARLDAARDIINHLRDEGEDDLADHAERLMRGARVHLLLGAVPGMGKGRITAPARKWAAA